MFAASSPMHRFVRPLAAALLAALFLPAAAGAQRAVWSVNGHAYVAVVVPGGISWTAASAAAQAAGGHLATVTSAAENAFVFALVDHPQYWNQEPGGSDLGPWLGGYQTSDSGDPSANWVWVTGEPWSYTAWFTGEPNNYTGAAENYLSYKCTGTAGCRSSGWNDLPDAISQFGTAVLAYVIEYDGPVGVGEPSRAPGVQLRANVPNPFTFATAVRFELPSAADVRLVVADVAGRTLRVLADGRMPAGAHTATWDGLDQAGRSAAPGCYFARLSALGTYRTVGMRLVR